MSRADIAAQLERLVAEGKAVKRLGDDGEMYLSLPSTPASEREWLEADRAFVARMVDEEPDDEWSTRKHMWRQRLAAIDEELKALAGES